MTMALAQQAGSEIMRRNTLHAQHVFLLPQAPRALGFVRVKPRPLQRQFPALQACKSSSLLASPALARLRKNSHTQGCSTCSVRRASTSRTLVRQGHAPRNRTLCRMMSRRPLAPNTLYGTHDAHLLELRILWSPATALCLAQAILVVSDTFMLRAR